MKQTQILAGPGIMQTTIATALLATTTDAKVMGVAMENLIKVTELDKKQKGVGTHRTAAATRDLDFIDMTGAGHQLGDTVDQSLQAKHKRGRGARKGWSGKRPAGTTEVNVRMLLDDLGHTEDDDVAPSGRGSKHHPRRVDQSIDGLCVPEECLFGKIAHSGLHAS